jgi:outer membrane protein
MIRNKLSAWMLLGSFAIPSLAWADTKYAFVDMQRALEETEDGKKAKARLKAEFDRKQKELDDRQEEIKKMKDALDKKAAIMKPEAIEKDKNELQKRFVELQEIYARLQRDLAAKEQDTTRPIMTKIQTVVSRIAERDHFAMVLEKSVVMWGQPSLDITNEVIRMYNSSAGGEKPAGEKK